MKTIITIFLIAGSTSSFADSNHQIITCLKSKLNPEFLVLDMPGNGTGTLLYRGKKHSMILNKVAYRQIYNTPKLSEPINGTFDFNVVFDNYNNLRSSEGEHDVQVTLHRGGTNPEFGVDNAELFKGCDSVVK